jgi:hypothetical protein
MNISETNKFILQNRIYPAIKSCVNNRYKIIIGIISYYSFIFQFKDKISYLIVIKILLSTLFYLLVLLNSINYYTNYANQIELENEFIINNKDDFISKWHQIISKSFIEFFFSIIILISIILFSIYCY